MFVTIAIGNEPAVKNGASMYNLSDVGVLTHEFELDEQGSHNKPHHHSTGEVVVCGTDPTGDWSYGNIYVREANTPYMWEKRRTLSNVIHTWGVTEHNNKLYVATGAHTGDNATWVGKVFWSSDIGTTWEGSADVNSYRVYDIISFGGHLYAQGQPASGIQAMYKSEDNGETWNTVVGVTPRMRPRFVIHLDELIIVDYGLANLLTLNQLGEVSATLTPPSPIANSYNVVASVDGVLFVLCGSGADEVYKYENEEWSLHTTLDAACISLINFNDEFLIASCPTNDTIIKVPLAFAEV